MKKILLSLAVIFIAVNSYSQKITGTISDSLSKGSLIGATITYEPGKGSVTDINGNYFISVKPGTYNLEISYFGYKKIKQSIQVKGDTILNFVMSPTHLELGSVTISAKSNKESVNELVKIQSNSATVVDGTNAETFKKTPDNKVSDVFKRISGASVQENKFVIIRGLNDRYNFGLINGAPLPSSESDRRAFSFDIFPSNMLDNLTIVKSASPELPGEFAGGVININTSEPKESNFQTLQIGLGYNTISTFQNYKFRIVGGLRIESYNQKFNYIEFGSNISKSIDTTVIDLLPSINGIYSINNKMKIRTSYYRTVSRPEFRELAPFTFYNFVTDNIISGDPNLKRATIDNIDLRWELYPGKGQIITVSTFYKKFDNPIEMINRTGTSGAPELYFSNVQSAQSFGSEIEVRINLGTLAKKESKIWDNITFYTNASLIKSSVCLDGFNGTGGDRPLQGQSPYILNTGLFYNTPKKDMTATISYNYIGPRIFIVGNVQEPSVWENGRHVLDLQISKKFKNKVEFKLNIKDALAQRLIYFQDLNNNRKYDKSVDNTWQEITFGQTISASFKYTF